MSTEDAELEAAIVKHMNYCDELGLNRVYDIGVMFDRREVEGAELINYAYIYSKAERKKKLPYHLKEKGRYLTHYDYGYDREDENLHKVLDFAREKGYKVGEYFYEDVMIDDLSVKSYDEHIVKLSIKLL
ncbi:MAG: hypothetical protein RR626_06685 [Anaerovoracaceae bacterium]